MPELADEIDQIIESLEMVANYGPDGMMVNADSVLFANCIRLKVIANELRKSDSATPDYTSLPSFPKASDISQGELTITNCKTQNS